MRLERLLRNAALALLGLGILLGASWLTNTVQPQVAYAHSFVIGSDPVDGSTIRSAPSVVRIFFDAPISPSSGATVYNPSEQVVNAAHSSIPANNPDELVTPLKNYRHLPLGGYTVRWSALASADGHTTHGVIGFNIGYSSTGLSGVTIVGPTTSNIMPEFDSIGVLTTVWEWLVLAALTFWIGTLVIEGFVLTGVEQTSHLLARCRKQSLPLQWLCLAALLVGEIIVLILRDVEFALLSNGSAFDLNALGSILFQSEYGYLWIAREVLILAAMGILWYTRQRQPLAAIERKQAVSRSSRKNAVRDVGMQFIAPLHPSPQKNAPHPSTSQQTIEEETNEESATLEYSVQRWPTIAGLTLAGLIVLARALTGNAAQLTEPYINSVIFEWFYLTAQAVWLGGLAYIAYILLPLVHLVEQERRSETLPALLQRCQPFLLSAVAVVVASELLLSEASLYNIQLFASDPYGRTFLIKWVLILLLFALSGYIFAVLRPKMTRQTALLPVVDAELPARRVRQVEFDQSSKRLKLLLRLQAWLGALVLLCVALMAFFAPPIVFPNRTYSQYPNSSSTNSSNNIQTKQVGNLTVTLEIKPDKAGVANTVTVTLKNRPTGNFVTNAHIKVDTNMQIMDMGAYSATMTGGNPTYTATFTPGTAFLMAGTWNINLFIQQPGQSTVTVQFPVTIL